MGLTKIKKIYVRMDDVRMAVRANFNILCIDTTNKEPNRLTVTFNDPEAPSINIECHSMDRSACGIHIHSLETLEELGYHLRDAIESCFNDGFETIHIHNK